MACVLTIASLAVNAQNIGIQPVTLWHPEVGHYVDVILSIRGTDQVEHDELSLFVALNHVASDQTSFDKVKVNQSLDGNKTYVEQVRLSADTGIWDLYVIRMTADEILDSIVHRMHIEPMTGSQLAPLLLTEPAQEESTVRYGLKVQPRPVFGMAVYDDTHPTMTIYQEVYGEGRDAFQMFTELRDEDDAIQRAYRHQTSLNGGLNRHVYEFDMADLPRGIYTFHTYMTDPITKDTVAHESKSIYRHRPLTSESWQRGQVSRAWSRSVGRGDTSHWHLNSLYPIATRQERRQIDGLLAQANDTLTWLFFQHFWTKRDPVKPSQEWDKYMDLIWKIEDAYGTRQVPGYASDRGRIMLQYGPPSRQEQRPFESDGYPFEIWQYDVVKSEGLSDQFNRLFVFADYSTVGRNYVLIHSDARGEVQNPRWRIALQQRTYIVEDLDHTGSDDEAKWGSRIYDNMFFNSGGR